MYTIVYFSPTGNTKYLATMLNAQLHDDEGSLMPLEFTDPMQIKSDEHLILMYSIHGFNAPRTVKRFVRNLPSGLFESVSLIGVGCNTSWVNDAVSSDLRKVLEKKNYSIQVDRVIAMPLTFIMKFDDELTLKIIHEADTQIRNISQAVQTMVKSRKQIAFKSKAIHVIGKAEDVAARFFGLELHANARCNACGVCVNNCPERNIRFNRKEKPKFGLKCLMCMRCVCNCPQKAIHPRLAKFIPLKDGYSMTAYLQDGACNPSCDSTDYSLPQ